MRDTRKNARYLPTVAANEICLTFPSVGISWTPSHSVRAHGLKRASRVRVFGKSASETLPQVPDRWLPFPCRRTHPVSASDDFHWRKRIRKLAAHTRSSTGDAVLYRSTPQSSLVCSPGLKLADFYVNSVMSSVSSPNKGIAACPSRNDAKHYSNTVDQDGERAPNHGADVPKSIKSNLEDVSRIMKWWLDNASEADAMMLSLETSGTK